MLNADGMHVKSNNAQRATVVILIVGNGKFQMIVEIVFREIQSGITGRGSKSNGITSNSVIQMFIAHQYWHLVKC